MTRKKQGRLPELITVSASQTYRLEDIIEEMTEKDGQTFTNEEIVAYINERFREYANEGYGDPPFYKMTDPHGQLVKA